MGLRVGLDDEKTRKDSVAQARIRAPDCTARGLVRIPTTQSRLPGFDVVAKKKHRLHRKSNSCLQFLDSVPQSFCRISCPACCRIVRLSVYV